MKKGFKQSCSSFPKLTQQLKHPPNSSPLQTTKKKGKKETRQSIETETETKNKIIKLRFTEAFLVG